MYELYYYPDNASILPHFLLEEIGVPFQLRRVSRETNEQKSEAYRKLNPYGLIPVFVDGDTVLYETVAICLYLSDKHADCGLAPQINTPQRGHFYKWLMYLATTVHPDTLIYYHPERYTQDGDGAPALKAVVEERIVNMFRSLDDHLAQAGPYMQGERVSFIDHYLLMLARWCRNMRPPVRDLAHVNATLRRVLKRPAVQRVIATEDLPSSFY